MPVSYFSELLTFIVWKGDEREVETIKLFSSLKPIAGGKPNAFNLYHFALTSWLKDKSKEMDISRAYYYNSHIPSLLQDQKVPVGVVSPERYIPGTYSEVFAFLSVAYKVWMLFPDALSQIASSMKSNNLLSAVPGSQIAAYTLKDLGNECFKRGDFRGAIKHYDAAISGAGLSVISTVLASNRAACYNQLKEFSKSVEYTTSFLHIDPHYSKLIYRRTQAFMGIEYFVPAYHLIEYAILIEPNEQLLLKLKEEVIEKLSKKNDFTNLTNCAHCGKFKQRNMCSYCHNAFYCNKKCQSSHWIVHKHLCFKWKKLKN